MGTGPDWNHYRKIINAMRKYGMAKQAEDVAKLVRVVSALEQDDMPKAVHRMMTELPQKVVRVDGSI